MDGWRASAPLMGSESTTIGCATRPRWSSTPSRLWSRPRTTSLGLRNHLTERRTAPRCPGCAGTLGLATEIRPAGQAEGPPQELDLVRHDELVLGAVVDVEG